MPDFFGGSEAAGVSRARPTLATTAFGQQLFPLWPRPTCGHDLKLADVGLFSELFFFENEEAVGDPNQRARSVRAPNGWGLKGWGNEGLGARRGGGPQFRALFPLSRHNFHSFLPLWGSEPGRSGVRVYHISFFCLFVIFVRAVGLHLGLDFDEEKPGK